MKQLKFHIEKKPKENLQTKEKLQTTDKKKIEDTSAHKIFSVSQINSLIRGTLEGGFGNIWVQGEISNFKPYSSGHFYFSLKDKEAQVSAVMFKGFNSKLKFKPENGLEVIAQGKVTVYEPRGNYQIFCKNLEPVGAGALQISFEQLKAKLQKEGLFSNKQALPQFPKHIVLVTSPSGAAVRDMIQVLKRRSKPVQITLVPTLVQGASAAASIVEGIALANKIQNTDLIIVGRGGGSIEDLWSFNEEKVARAIFASQKPIISAVGHEIDFTISDFVADLRAPTPSAAAELAVKDTNEIIEKVLYHKNRLIQAQKNYLSEKKNYINHLKKFLSDPSKRVFDLSQKIDELTVRLENNAKRLIFDKWSQLKNTTSLMESLSPLKVLNRGFAIIKSSSQELIKDAKQVQQGDSLKIEMARSYLDVEVKKIQKKTNQGVK